MFGVINIDKDKYHIAKNRHLKNGGYFFIKQLLCKNALYLSQVDISSHFTDFL